MPIEFRCSQCNNLLRTGDETAGRQAQCPACGALTTVPMPAEANGLPADLGSSPFGLGSLQNNSPPSDNPYQSPAAPAYQILGRADPFVLQRVAAPATALIVTAILGIVGDVLAIAFFSFVLLQPDVLGRLDRHDPSLYVNLGVGIISLPVGVVMLIGALKMKKLESYGLAMAGAILGMLPYASPCCILGLPFGIWALVVLSDNSVKAAFHNRTN
jgi:hypothetical protein